MPCPQDGHSICHMSGRPSPRQSIRRASLRVQPAGHTATISEGRYAASLLTTSSVHQVGGHRVLGEACPRQKQAGSLSNLQHSGLGGSRSNQNPPAADIGPYHGRVCSAHSVSHRDSRLSNRHQGTSDREARIHHFIYNSLDGPQNSVVGTPMRDHEKDTVGPPTPTGARDWLF